MTASNPTTPPPQTPGPGGDTGIGAAPAGLNPGQQSAWSILNAVLESYGFTAGDLTALAAWGKKEIISGAGLDQIALDLQQTQQFKNRFPGIAMREKNGLPPITPAEYVQLENSYTQILRQAGLPLGFYDKPADFAQLVGFDVAPTELNDRISNAFDVVNTAPSEVQNAFTGFYGVGAGRSALAAYVIDPTRAEPALLKQVQTAQIAGTGAQYGFGVQQSQAEKLAAVGIDVNQAQQGFKQAGMFQSLIHGGINEASPLGESQVIAGEFGQTPGATVALQQALLGKQAAFGGGGQASETNTGISGLGKASSI